jgi:anti-anti-sigma factor
MFSDDVGHKKEDRCPYHRPFEPSFDGCPTFQAVTFVAADSTNRVLGRHTTCRHLTGGTLAPGQYYARCAIGSEGDRLRWLARVGPARLEGFRAIQADFDACMAVRLSELLDAKAELLRSGESPKRRAAMETRLGAFLDDASAFVDQNSTRIAELELSTAAIKELVHEWAELWLKSRAVEPTELDMTPPASAVADVHDSNGEPRKAEAITGQLLMDDGRLRVHRTFDPRGLIIAGEIDAANLDGFTEAVNEVAAEPGDLSIDMSGVSFCDLGGLRVLVRVAQDVRVVISGLPPQLEHVLRLVGWAAVSNFVVVQE